MGIHDEDVARVRETTDIVALIGEYVQLKRVGRRWVGICPFHAEKTPSFSVNAEMGVYHCFGCKASGDAITFVREIEHADFPEAVERLAAKVGMSLRYTDPGEGAGKAKRGKLTEALQQAVEWYHQRLLTSSDAGLARRYLRERGYDGAVVRQYKLGWAPDDWDLLAQELEVGNKGGMDPQVFFDAGLGFRNKGGRIQDSFRARLLFPIFDASNKPVGFGGRVLPGGEGPKYKNSVDNAVYRKSRVLYGLNWAKQDIVNAGEVIVCEGYTDVIGCHQAGLPRAVATCGTALTEDHVRMLRRYAARIVLAFDADSAGQSAAERFSQWEHSFDLEVVVADLPAGTDPGDLAQSNPERLTAGISQAEDFLDFRINRVLGEADLDSLKGQVRASERAARLVAEHPNSEVRDKYLVQVADRCSVSAAHLRKVVEGARRRSPRRSQRPPSQDAPHPADIGYEPGVSTGGYGESDAHNVAALEASEGPSSPPPHNVERQVLWVAIHNRGAVWPEIVPEMFNHSLYRGVFEALLEYPDMETLLRKADSPVATLIRELGVEEDEELHNSNHRRGVAMAIFLYESAQRELMYLERQARNESAEAELLSQAANLKATMEQLRASDWAPEQARVLLKLLRPVT